MEKCQFLKFECAFGCYIFHVHSLIWIAWIYGYGYDDDDVWSKRADVTILENVVNKWIFFFILIYFLDSFFFFFFA